VKKNGDVGRSDNVNTCWGGGHILKGGTRWKGLIVKGADRRKGIHVPIGTRRRSRDPESPRRSYDKNAFSTKNQKIFAEGIDAEREPQKKQTKNSQIKHGQFKANLRETPRNAKSQDQGKPKRPSVEKSGD